jgi:hypothetical protein
MSDATTAPARRIIDVNLLPREQRPADVPPLAIAIAVAIVAGLAVLAPLAFRAHAARDRADAVERRAADAERSLRGVEVHIAEHRGLRLQLDAVNAQLTALRDERAHLQGGARPLGDDLAELWGWGYLPAGARITAVSGTDRGFKVDGAAPDPLLAIAYADALVKQGQFASARMASFTPGATGGQFSIEVMR